MRCVVTGGAGFIGSAIAAALIERGDEVVVLDSFVTGRSDAVPAGAEVVRGDICDPSVTGEAMRGAEVVWHQAAIRSVPKSVDAPEATNEANVTGTLQVLLAAEAAGVRRLVYASSSSVYGDTKGERNHEALAPSPMSPYAVSKLAGEHYCRVWSALGRLSTVSLRYFNVFGPGQHAESQYSAVFPAFVSALLAGEPPVVHWDGEQSRDFSYIDDVVRANLLAADAGPDADGRVFNIGSGAPKSVNDVLEAVAKQIRWIPPEYTDRRAGDVRSTHADISAARDILRWQPQTPWEEAVAATVAWFGGPKPS